MPNPDAEVSDITVVLKKECADKLNQTVAELKKLEMKIEETDGDNGVIEGTIPADKLPHIKSWPCIEYVRVDFTYIAEYPLGDPRNHAPVDNDEDADDAED